MTRPNTPSLRWTDTLARKPWTSFDGSEDSMADRSEGSMTSAVHYISYINSIPDRTIRHNRDNVLFVYECSCGKRLIGSKAWVEHVETVETAGETWETVHE